MSHIVRWAATAAFLALACTLLGAPTQAFAYEVHYVGSYDDAPPTDAYLDNINGRRPDEVRVSTSVGSFERNGGTSYFVRDDSYVPESSPKTLREAVTLLYRGAGTTVDGRSLDLTVAMDVTWSHARESESGYCPMFLEINENKDYAFAWLSGACNKNADTGDPAATPSSRQGISVVNNLTVTESDTGKPYGGRVLLWFFDMDQWWGGRFSRESVELLSGFANDIYVGANTLLDKGALGSGLFQPVDGSGDDGTHTDAVVFTQGPSARVRWQGENCSTVFKARYPSTYPDVADDVVYAPKKSVASIGGRRDATVGCSGERVVYEVSQFLPYVVEENKPAVTEFVDELDPRLDPATAEVRVLREGKDVTDLWDVRVVGQTVRATSKDTREAVLDLLFEVSVESREGAVGTLKNRATTHIRTRTDQDVVKESNEVEVRLRPMISTVVIEKVLHGTPQGAHGTPVYPFVLDVSRTDGSHVSLGAWAVLDGDRTTGPDGEESAEVSVDLSAIEPWTIDTVRVREIPVSRYTLASVTSPTKGASIEGDQAVFPVGDLESGDVRARFENRKITDRWAGHNAMAVNTVETRPVS